MSHALAGRPVVRAVLALALLLVLIPTHALAATGVITATIRERGTGRPIGYPVASPNAGGGSTAWVHARAYRWDGSSWVFESADMVGTGPSGGDPVMTIDDFLPAGEYIIVVGSGLYVYEYVGRCALRAANAMRFTVSDDSTTDIGTVYVTSAHARAGGEDRYGTAVATSRLFFDPGTETVVIASGEEFPDGLAASGLAGAVRAPLLLSRSASIDEVVLDEIDRLGAETVYIVGGTAAVGAAVQAAVDSRPSVDQVVRIAGQDRYETAAAVARQVELLVGGSFPKKAFLVRGDDFPDAVSVSPYVFSQHIPVLLTRPGALPSASAQALADLEVTEVFIAGGTTAVSDAVALAAGALGDGIAVRRLSGSNRYGTAFRVADYAIERGWAAPNVDPTVYVALATGENFPDALAGGPACGVREGVMLLTRPNGYQNGEEKPFLSEHWETLGWPGEESFVVMGQEDVVSVEVVNDFWLTRNAYFWYQYGGGDYPPP